MILLYMMSVIAAQSSSVTVPPPLEITTARRRPTLATLEGTPGAATVGLFDLRDGQFTPERLDPALLEWTDLAPAPIDFSGRCRLLSGLPGTPQLRNDSSQGSRILLPWEAGSLWLLSGRRAGTPGFALVHVRPDGSPRLLLAQDALAFGESPFLPKVSISPDASGVLVATRLDAGGDLYEFDLSRGVAALRTGQLPPLDFGIDGVWLGDTWGFGIAGDGPYRFLRQPGASAQRVQVQGVPPQVWRRDASMNTSCGAAVAVAGTAPAAWLPFVFGSSGDARAASTMPQNIAPAGFAPEVSFGPFLALCNDGITAAWCVDDSNAMNEPFTDLFLGRAGLIPQTMVATGDQQMVDTVNEIGSVIPAPAGGAIFAVGEPNDPSEGGLEGAEVMSAEMDSAGALTLQNLSRTSTDTAWPLFSNSEPTWTPAQFVLLDDEFALIHEDDEKLLITLSLITGQRTTVLNEVREVYWAEPAGVAGGWAAAVERDDSARLQQVIGSASPTQLASVLDPGSPTAQFLYPVACRPDSTVAYARRDGGLEFLDVADVALLQIHRWSPTPASFTPPFAFLRPGGLLFTRQAGAAGGEQRLWNFRTMGQDRVISSIVRPSMILR